MKIIAKTGPNHSHPDVIVQMSARELALLVFCTTYKTAEANELSVGRVFAIDKRYERLHELERNRQKLDEAIQQIRAVATVIEPLLPIVECPKPADPPAPPEGERGGEANG